MRMRIVTYQSQLQLATLIVAPVLLVVVVIILVALILISINFLLAVVVVLDTLCIVCLVHRLLAPIRNFKLLQWNIY